MLERLKTTSRMFFFLGKPKNVRLYYHFCEQYPKPHRNCFRDKIQNLIFFDKFYIADNIRTEARARTFNAACGW